MLPWNISAVGTCRGSMASETLRIALKLFLSHHRLVSNESWIYCKDLQESPWSYHNHIMTISWWYHDVSLHQWDASRKTKKHVSEQTQENCNAWTYLLSSGMFKYSRKWIALFSGIASRYLWVNKNGSRLPAWPMRYAPSSFWRNIWNKLVCKSMGTGSIHLTRKSMEKQWKYLKTSDDMAWMCFSATININIIIYIYHMLPFFQLSNWSSNVQHPMSGVHLPQLLDLGPARQWLDEFNPFGTANRILLQQPAVRIRVECHLLDQRSEKMIKIRNQ